MSGRKRQDAIVRSSRGRRGGRFLGWLLVLLFLALPAVPHVAALRLPAPHANPADAVIVLSGGEGRIPEGYRIWRSGAGKDLCILGAGRHVNPRLLLPGAAELSREDLARIRVEGWSENTLENAFSAKSIVEQRGYSSVILVTSDYHVARASLAFRRVLPPEVDFSVARVNAGSGSPSGNAWRWARRHYLEGWKYWGYRVLLRWE